MQNDSPHALLAITRGFMEARVLLTGAALDLFTTLEPAPMTAPQIAERLVGDLRAVTALLDALAAMELLHKASDRYANTAAASRYLVSTSPESALPMVLHNENLWWRWSQLTSIVSGAAPQATDGGPRRPSLDLEAFIGAMHVIGSPLAPRIVEQVAPGSALRLIDVGGASGTYTAAFLRANPAMRATIFDRPPVIEMARRRMEADGLADRVDLAPGDFDTDELPGGHDLAFLSAIIHQNSRAENVALYGRVFRALVPGGRIVIRDHVMAPDHVLPRSGALFAINMLVGTPGGGCYTLQEIAEDLGAAGFDRVRLMQGGEQMDGLVEAFRA